MSETNSTTCGTAYTHWFLHKHVVAVSRSLLSFHVPDAHQQQKDMIPLMVEKDYNVKGWRKY
eukprot:COSAG02_NODE_4131_length_5739_cov_5.860993_5_plen_62_part_00